MRTHDNRSVRFYDDLIKGKVVVINFMSAECEGICPGMTANLVRVQKLLGPRVGRDIFMYSITLEPDHDSPAVLSAYARDHGAGPGWAFLTGRREDSDAVGRVRGAGRRPVDRRVDLVGDAQGSEPSAVSRQP